MGLTQDLKIAFRERQYLPLIFSTNTEDTGNEYDEMEIVKNSIPSLTKLVSQAILGFPGKRGTTPLKAGNFPEDGDEKWYFINGICTNREILQLNGSLLSKLFQRNIYCLHNPTNGIAVDLAECIAGRTLDINEPVTRNLARYVEESIMKDLKVKVIAHSQGGIIVSNMIKYFYMKGLQMRNLEIYTFASAADGESPLSNLYQEHFANEEDYVARIGLLAPEYRPKTLFLRPGGKGHLLNRNYLSAFAKGQFGTNSKLFSYLENG